MPCKDALVEKVTTLKPEQTVKEALAILENAKTGFAPVIDDDGRLAGIFSLIRLLEDTLPVSVSVDNKTLGNVRIPAAPGMSKRLQKKKNVTVEKIMKKNPDTVSPDSSIEAAVTIIRRTGSGVPVVDASGLYLGIVTSDSILSYLEKEAG